MEFIKVEKVDNTKHYKGKVYDLKIHGRDHSYNIDGFIVHNSVGGSLVACCVGLIKWVMDPIKNGLIFERFISEARLADCVIDYKDYN